MSSKYLYTKWIGISKASHITNCVLSKYYSQHRRKKYLLYDNVLQDSNTTKNKVEYLQKDFKNRDLYNKSIIYIQRNPCYKLCHTNVLYICMDAE